MPWPGPLTGTGFVPAKGTWCHPCPPLPQAQKEPAALLTEGTQVHLFCGVLRGQPPWEGLPTPPHQGSLSQRLPHGEGRAPFSLIVLERPAAPPLAEDRLWEQASRVSTGKWALAPGPPSCADEAGGKGQRMSVHEAGGDTAGQRAPFHLSPGSPGPRCLSSPS